MISSPLPRVLLPAAAALALAACGGTPVTDRVLSLVTPYRIEVVQGNVVTKEMAAALKPGMSRPQVRDALGSPLLTDIFHADRWDYVFTIKRQGAPYQQRRVTLYFDGETLKSFEADELPSEQEFVASIDTTRTRGKTPVLALTEQQIQALPAPRPGASAPGAAPQGAQRSYPPLEPAQ